MANNTEWEDTFQANAVRKAETDPVKKWLDTEINIKINTFKNQKINKKNGKWNGWVNHLKLNQYKGK